MMPSFSHGKNTRIFIGKYEPTVNFRSVSAPLVVDTSETSAFGTQYKSHVVGMLGGTVALEGMFDGVTVDGLNDQMVLWFGQDTPTPLTVTHQGVTVGKPALVGEAKQTNYTVAGSTGDMVSATADAIWTDGVGHGFILHNPDSSTNVSASGSDTGVLQLDDGTPSVYPVTAECWAALHILSAPTPVTGGTVQFIVEHSADDITYATLLSFTAYSGSSVYTEYVHSTGFVTINKYVRAGWVRGSSAVGQVNALVSFARSAQQ